MTIGINRKRTYKDFDKIVSENRSAIMGLAMLSVMLFHQYFTSVFPFNVFHNFGYWGVDVFLFLSGMGLVRSIETNPLPLYYKRRFIRIIPCCILCGVTKYIVFLSLGSSVAILKDGLKIGWWSLFSFDLWFIPTILILYIISPLLHNLLRKSPSIVIIVISILMLINGLTLRPVIGFNWTSPEGVLSYTIERTLVFALGMLVSIRKGSEDSNISYSTFSLTIAVVIAILGKSGIQPFNNTTYSLLALAFGLPALVAINILIIKISPPILKRFINFMGRHSLELYLVHEFIFWSMKINFDDSYPLLLLVIGLLISCLIAHFCKLSLNRLLT